MVRCPIKHKTINFSLYQSSKPKRIDPTTTHSPDKRKEAGSIKIENHPKLVPPKSNISRKTFNPKITNVAAIHHYLERKGNDGRLQKVRNEEKKINILTYILSPIQNAEYNFLRKTYGKKRRRKKKEKSESVPPPLDETSKSKKFHYGKVVEIKMDESTLWCSHETLYTLYVFVSCAFPPPVFSWFLFSLSKCF